MMMSCRLLMIVYHLQILDSVHLTMVYRHHQVEPHFPWSMFFCLVLLVLGLFGGGLAILYLGYGTVLYVRIFRSIIRHECRERDQIHRHERQEQDKRRRAVECNDGLLNVDNVERTTLIFLLRLSNQIN